MSQPLEDRALSPTVQRERRCLVILYAFAMVLSLAVMPAVEWSESIRFQNNSYEILLLLVVMIPFFIAVGYAFVLPLLLFHRAITRYGLAILLQLPLWTLYFVGFWIAFDQLDPDTWAMVAALVVLALFGGFIPIAIAVGLGGWRLGTGKTDRLPVGIQDLLVVIALAAVGLTIFRQSGILEGEEMPNTMIIMMLGFYALSGTIVFSSLLLAIRLTLDSESRILRPRSLLGILLTICLVTALWSILWLADDSTFSQTNSPYLQIGIFSLFTWLVAVSTAFLIGWSLRRNGFRLTTRETDLLGLAAEEQGIESIHPENVDSSPLVDESSSVIES